MKGYHELEKVLLSNLFQAKENKSDLKEVKELVNNLIINYGTGMVEIIKDLNNANYTHITINNGLNNNFFIRINEDFITLKGKDYIENNNFV